MNEEQLQKLYEDIQAGKFDAKGFINAFKKMTSGDESDSFTYQQQQDLLGRGLQLLRNDPEAQKDLKQHLRDTAGQRFTKQYKPFFHAILNGVDLATSLDQIRTSNNALKTLVQPAIAGSPGVPDSLKAQLSNAQQGTMAAARAIAPAQQQIEQQYQNDINTAKQTSGGNVGNFMANSQVASLAKQKAAAQLPMIQDAIQNRYQTRADQLSGQLGQLGQQDFGNRLFATQLALDQYNRQANAAGLLGSTGRLNLRNTLQGIPNTITSILGQSYNPNMSQVSGIPSPSQVQAPVRQPMLRSNDYGRYGKFAEDINNSFGATSYIPDTNFDKYSNPNIY